MVNLDKYERQHRQYLAGIERQVLAIYETAAREAASIGMSVGDLTDDLFSFDRYPITHERIGRLMQQFHDRLEAIVVDGVNSGWTLANNKNSELVRRVYGNSLNSLTLEQQRRYFSNREDAREAFLARKVQGLGLSDRVWRYTDLYKREIELGIDVGLRAGSSADELSRELRSYLKFPDNLFRRVRDQHDNIVLSHAAKAFHPGQGVYRSSYMNARRLAATETNIAYRTADYERIKDLDFVVGIEVHLSSNHTCKGVEGVVRDICDELQGKYPKDFKFTGWHPHCRCYTTTILKTPAELEADNERILRGEEPSEGSVNEVQDVPQNFKDWVLKNGSRTAKATNIPYWMSDNSKRVSEIYHSKSPSSKIGDQVQKFLGGSLRYLGRDPQLDAILWNLSLRDELPQMEKAILTGRAREIIANLTYVDLQRWGAVSEDMVMSRVLKDCLIEQGRKCVVNGHLINIRRLEMDILVLKDKYGMEFAYPVGVGRQSVLFEATKASEVVHNMPPFLRRSINRVSFFPETCPFDQYWKVKNNNPNHVSAATDGGRVTFWNSTLGLKEGDFRRYIIHEATHALDGGTPDKYKISTTSTWKDAVEKDIALNKGWYGGYPSEYAKTRLSEDFAESMMMYLIERERMQDWCPHRSAFIRDLTHKLGRRCR